MSQAVAIYVTIACNVFLICWFGTQLTQHVRVTGNNNIIIIIRYVCLLSQAFLPGTSLEPAVIPNAQTSIFTLQYFPYYV